MKKFIFILLSLCLSATMYGQADSTYYQITVLVNPQQGGTATGAGMYTPGSVVTAVATPATGYSFIGWSVNGMLVTLDTAFTFIVNSDLTLQAAFAGQPDSFIVSSAVYPVNAGTVNGTGWYKPGDTATLSINKAAGYGFYNWQVNGIVVSADTVYSFVVTGNIHVTANLFQLPQLIEVKTETYPLNSGTATGAGFYFTGDTVHLQAHPNTSYTFANWQVNGIIVSTDTNFSFIATGNVLLHVNFTETTVFYDITAEAMPADGGNISGTGSAVAGSSITLTATANSNFIFQYWKDGDTVLSYDNDYTFVVNNNRHLEAYFTETTGIEDNGATGLLLAPNSCYGNCRIIAEESYSLTVCDIHGKVVLEETADAGVNSLELNMPGLYLLQFKTQSGKVSTRKLMVK
jgi:hypothetical protein